MRFEKQALLTALKGRQEAREAPLREEQEKHIIKYIVRLGN